MTDKLRTSIETINGELMTVVWHEKSYHNVPIEALTCDECIVQIKTCNSSVLFCDYDTNNLIATALTALPKLPKPEDAALLYRYMAEGIVIHCNYYTLGDENEYTMEYDKIHERGSIIKTICFLLI